MPKWHTFILNSMNLCLIRFTYTEKDGMSDLVEKRDYEKVRDQTIRARHKESSDSELDKMLTCKCMIKM